MPRRTGLLAVSPPRTLLALATISLSLSASVGPSSAATEPATDVSAITLVEQRLIEIPGSRLLPLSPDGGSIAVARPDGSDATELCVHEVATLEERVCADLSDLESGLWHDMVVWSPDSRWLAFAELWPQYFAGGGLWLMDASTGALTNLLDDSALALYPTFTPDSTAVTFERTLLDGGTPNEELEFKSMDIATVPITGGEAVRLDDSERQARTSSTRGWPGPQTDPGSMSRSSTTTTGRRPSSIPTTGSGSSGPVGGTADNCSASLTTGRRASWRPVRVASTCSCAWPPVPRPGRLLRHRGWPVGRRRAHRVAATTLASAKSTNLAMEARGAAVDGCHRGGAFPGRVPVAHGLSV